MGGLNDYLEVVEMKKYNYGLRETLKFTKYMTIETDLPEDDLFEILDSAETVCDTAEDIAILLERKGINVIETPDNDYSSPDDIELEEWDFNEL